MSRREANQQPIHDLDSLTHDFAVTPSRVILTDL